MTPEDIVAVQRLLRALGRDVAVDGDGGPASRLAASEAHRAATGVQGIDPRAVALIKEFEGFRAEAYRDAVGVWTVGWGTTAAAGVGIDPGPGMKISEAEGEVYLRRALDKFADQIRPKITAPITPAELGAFLSLAYNIGPSAFGKSSALRKFNAGDKAGAADAILLWTKAAGRTLAGLVRRRKAERALFLA